MKNKILNRLIKQTIYFHFLIVLIYCFTAFQRVKIQKISPTIKIGNQEWMTKNLNVSTFRNGDPIILAKTQWEWIDAIENKKPACCYYKFDSSFGKKFGKLYNWYAVNDPRGLAPKGWAIPTLEQWSELIDFLGGESIAGLKLKSSNGWENNYQTNGNGTNESGFSALPSGYIILGGNDEYRFDYMGSYTSWWSASMKDSISAWSIGIQNSYNSTDISGCWLMNGLPVRCVKQFNAN